MLDFHQGSCQLYQLLHLLLPVIPATQMTPGCTYITLRDPTIAIFELPVQFILISLPLVHSPLLSPHISSTYQAIPVASSVTTLTLCSFARRCRALRDRTAKAITTAALTANPTARTVTKAIVCVEVLGLASWWALVVWTSLLMPSVVGDGVGDMMMA